MAVLGRNSIIILALAALVSLAGLSRAAADEGALTVQQAPQGPARSEDNSVGHGHGFEARLMGPAAPAGTAAAPADCRATEIAGLSPAALIGFLQSQSLSCLRFLWSYNEAVASVLSEDHMRAVYRAIAATAYRWSEGSSEELAKRLFFVRIGHYHAFYQRFVFDESVRREAIKAFDALRPQVSRALRQTVPAPWLQEWVNAIDGADLAHRYLAAVKDLLRAFLAAPEKLENAAQQRIVYAALTVISRHIGNRSPDFLQVIDDDLIELLTVLALKAELLEEADYVLNAAVWALGRIGPLKPHQAAVIKALHQITQTYGPTPNAPAYRAPYLWVLQALDQYLSCPMGGIRICKSDLAGKLEAELFPHRYSFDDGAMIFETALSLDEVQPLYHAAKEVHSQFSRVTGALAPVKHDPNCILRVKIYGSKEAFSNYHWFLYGLPTNNGGIYIEPQGVFYTFQRTQRQSRYSLEELFRHEYVHYLVGRYLIDGFWGREPLYQQGRMVWFDEGFAEFLTWSSSDHGVRIRRSLVSQVARDRERLGIRQIIRSRYGDFKFYRYAGLLFNYFYEHDPTMLRQLLTAIRSADTTSYDQIMARLSRDSHLEKLYQRFLDEQVAMQASFNDPHTDFPDPALLDLDDVLSIETEFKRAWGSGSAVCQLTAHTLNRRFACHDELVGNMMATADYEAAWRDFDRRLNAMIIALRTEGRPNNFRGMNCHLGPIGFRSERRSAVYPVAAVYCEGPLAPRPLLPVDPVVQLVRDFQQNLPNAVPECAVAPDGRVECVVGVKTALYGMQADEALLDRELGFLIRELAHQVYATRPSFYGSLSCSEIGRRESVTVDSQTRYKKTEVNCVVELCPCAAVSVDPQSLKIL